ncbi:MAG TPA: phage tail tip lysozyme [Candidatus Saccharimonadales bacterium]|nr:phage tail tip lysozyme [Candidatus Saccharimonadales bacterium]
MTEISNTLRTNESNYLNDIESEAAAWDAYVQSLVDSVTIEDITGAPEDRAKFFMLLDQIFKDIANNLPPLEADTEIANVERRFAQKTTELIEHTVKNGKLTQDLLTSIEVVPFSLNALSQDLEKMVNDAIAAQEAVINAQPNQKKELQAVATKLSLFAAHYALKVPASETVVSADEFKKIQMKERLDEVHKVKDKPTQQKKREALASFYQAGYGGDVSEHESTFSHLQSRATEFIEQNGKKLRVYGITVGALASISIPTVTATAASAAPIETMTDNREYSGTPTSVVDITDESQTIIIEKEVVDKAKDVVEAPQEIIPEEAPAVEAPQPTEVVEPEEAVKDLEVPKSTPELKKADLIKKPPVPKVPPKVPAPIDVVEEDAPPSPSETDAPAEKIEEVVELVTPPSNKYINDAKPEKDNLSVEENATKDKPDTSEEKSVQNQPAETEVATPPAEENDSISSPDSSEKPAQPAKEAAENDNESIDTPASNTPILSPTPSPAPTDSLDVNEPDSHSDNPPTNDGNETENDAQNENADAAESEEPVENTVVEDEETGAPGFIASPVPEASETPAPESNKEAADDATSDASNDAVDEKTDTETDDSTPEQAKDDNKSKQVDINTVHTDEHGEAGFVVEPVDQQEVAAEADDKEEVETQTDTEEDAAQAEETETDKKPEKVELNTVYTDEYGEAGFILEPVDQQEDVVESNDTEESDTEAEDEVSQAKESEDADAIEENTLHIDEEGSAGLVVTTPDEWERPGTETEEDSLLVVDDESGEQGLVVNPITEEQDDDDEPADIAIPMPKVDKPDKSDKSERSDKSDKPDKPQKKQKQEKKPAKPNILSADEQAVVAADRLINLDGEWKNRGIVMKILIKHGGLLPMHAAGIVGNTMVESPGLNPKQRQIGGGPGKGIGQWGSYEPAFDRFADLQAFAAKRGTSWDNLETQAYFILHELNGKESAAFAELKKTTSAAEAARIVRIFYERPNPVYAHEEDRVASAKLVAQKYNQQLGDIKQDQKREIREAKEAAQEAKERAKEKRERAAEKREKAQDRREARERQEIKEWYLPVPGNSTTSPQYPGHTGIDYAVAVGTPFYSMVGGKVEVNKLDVRGQQFCINAFNNLGASMAAISDPIQKEVRITSNIDGDEYVAIYAHMSSISVEDGERVKGGKRIGSTGDSGCSTGPHAHFEVLKNGVSIDPQQLAYLINKQ